MFSKPSQAFKYDTLTYVTDFILMSVAQYLLTKI